MRFKHLTATILRNAAIEVEERNVPMCWAVRGQVGLENWIREGRSEFEGLLEEMNVPTDGWLWLRTLEERTDREWDSDPELKAVRVLFLLTLADAVAYKSNGGKKRTNSEWFPTSTNPPRPGVYERDFGQKNNPCEITEYNLWNGNNWVYGNNDWKATAENLNRKDYRRFESDWRFIQDPEIAKAEQQWYDETFKNTLRPMSKFPSSVGVYVLKHENTDDHHFSYWNGQHWCYTCDDVESAIRLGKFHGKSPSVYDKNGVVNSCYVGWKTVDT
jgi:hypothetical protein